MRTPSRLSALRSPLTTLFARPAAARVLRELIISDRALVPQTIAEESGVSLPAVRAALADAVALRLVVTYDVFDKPERVRSYQMRRTHPLFEPLLRLYKVERRLAKDLFDELRAALTDVVETARSQGWLSGSVNAWVYGPVAAKRDEHTDPVQVLLVGPAACLPQVHESYMARVSEIGDKRAARVQVLTVAQEELATHATHVTWWQQFVDDHISLGSTSPHGHLGALGLKRPP